METQRVTPAEAYPTRRSLREAQRRAQRDRRRRTDPTPAPATSRSAVAANVPLVQASGSLPTVPAAPRVSWVPVGSPQVAPAAGPDQERAAAVRGPRRPGRLIPRVAILSSLAAATTVIPLNGPPTAPAQAEEGIEYNATDIADVLMNADSESAPVVETEALAADPLAGVRAAVTASRSESRTAPSCSTQAGSANGAAAAETAAIAPQLVMPLAEGSYRTTSRYGYRSLWGRHSMHAGVDFAAPVGTPIHAIADGVVEYTGPGKAGRSSMLIIVRHNINGNIVRSWYVHMYSNGVYVNAGQQVKAGQVIGGVGSNGNSTGPHLHFEVHLDDNLTTADPSVWLASNGAVPLSQEIRECLQN